MYKTGRKLGIWITAIVALIVACCLPYATFAAGIETEVITVPSTAGLLKEAAEIQLIVNTFQKCVGLDQIDVTSFNGSPNTPRYILSQSTAASNMFNRNINNEKPTGAWLEYQVQEKVNNGTIWCSDGDSAIVEVFAKKLGFSKEQIACNIYAGDGYEAGQRGGLFKRLVQGEPNGSTYYGLVGYNYNVVNDCIGGLSDPNAHYTWSDDGWNEDTDSSGTAKYIGGKGYIEFLYNQYRDEHLAENPYLVAWSDLGNFDTGVLSNAARAYYLYLNDFNTACGSEVVNPATTDSNRKWPAISIIDTNYGIVDTVYGKKTGMKDNWGSSFVNKDTPHTCGTVANRINELAPSTQSLLQNARKTICNMESRPIALRNQQDALAIINDPEMDDKSKAVAQDVYNRIEAMEDFGTYWTNTSEGGIVCMEIPSVTGATTIVDEVPLPPASNPEDDGPAANCYNSSTLGWIICPVINTLGWLTQKAYDYIKVNFLTVDASYVSDPGTLSAWRTFQGFANIIFVILFIIVIFSQITGIGLTNYGIKKALPKLIVVAVLVNISYIICAAAVDLSNILGESLETTFVNLAGGFSGSTPFSFGERLDEVLTFLLSGVVGGGIIVFTAFTWELWLPLFLLTLLGMVISVVFFFIVLAVRQAAVIILLVLAPLAIVCYALPNTKSMFDRWKKMFVSMLVVYPVCGALMGGGTFASTLLLSVSDKTSFFFNLVAMLITVVPFFFIPYLVKSSMAAIGNIGTKISNAGIKFRRGTTGLARNSDSFKELQNQMRGRHAAKFMQRDKFRKEHKILGAPGRAMDAIGSKVRKSNSWLGRLTTDMHNQKTARMANQAISTAALNRKAMNDVRSDYNKRLETAVNAADRSYINDLAKQTQEANANVTEIDELRDLHAAALDRFNSDGSSENLAAVEAFQNMMATSDPGRQAMYDNYAAAIAGGRAGGLMRAGQHLVNQHVGNIKANNRDFWALANDVASGRNFNANSFTEYTDRDGNKHYQSIDFNGRGIDSYTSADLPKMDIGSLDRLIQHAKEGKLNDLEKSRLEEMTREAIMSNTIHVQGKVEQRFNTLRKYMGYKEVTKTDSGSIPVPKDKRKKQKGRGKGRGRR